MNAERRVLAKNAVVQIAAKFIGTGLSLLTFYFLLHEFGESGFGVLTVAFTYTSVFAILVDFGLTLTTTQMISEHGADEKRLLGNLFSLRVLTAFLFLSIAPIASLFLPGTAELRLAITASSVSFFFGSVAAMFVGVFQKRQNIWQVAFAETLNRTVALLGVILAGQLGLGLVAAALAFTVGGAVQFIVTFLATIREVYVRPRWETSVLRQIITRSWPIGLSIFFNLIYLKGDILFMWLFGRSDTEIGFYGSAYKVVDVMTTIPTMIMGLTLPALAERWSRKDIKGTHEKLQESFDMLALMALPFGVGSVLVGVPLMEFIKPTLGPAGQILMILGPAAALVYFGVLYGHAVVALGKQRIMTLGYLLSAIVGVVGYSIYIPIYGMWAAAWVTFATEVLIAVLTFAVVAKTSGHLPKMLTFARATIASILMGLAIYFIPIAHVIGSIVMGIVVYAVALTLVGGPSPKKLVKLFV